MHGLIRLLEATDPELAQHGDRTARLARAVARQMGLRAAETERVEAGSRLHDIGKLFVSRRILDKPDAPTPEEWHELRRHPQLGFDLIKDRVAESVARIVLTHHEWSDGTGYPSRLSGIDIPIEARVLQVADAFDAITSERPYQPALPISYAVSELRRCSGTQFDPRAVRAMISLVRNRTSSLQDGVFATPVSTEIAV